MWKSCLNALPLKIGLRKRGFYVDEGCSLCRVEPETCLNVLRDCEFASKVWTIFSFGKLILGSCPSTSFEWIKYVASLLSEREWNLFIFCAWEIWNQRNARLHGGICKMPVEIVHYVISYVEEFGLANPRPPSNEATQEQNRRRNANWVLPPPGSFKINCERSVGSSSW